jgi:WD40 repeat protein
MAAHPFRRVASKWLSEGMREQTAADHRLVLTVTTDEYRCESFAFSADDKLLAIGKSNGMVAIWDLAARTPIKHFLHDLCGGEVTAVAFSADGRLLATGGRDGHLKLRDLRTAKILFRRPHPAAIQAVGFDPTGELVATACADAVLRVWTRRGRIRVQTDGGCSARTREVTVAPDGTADASDTHRAGSLSAEVTATALRVYRSSSG